MNSFSRFSLGDYAVGWCGSAGTMLLVDIGSLACSMGGVIGGGLMLVVRFVFTHTKGQSL